MRTEIAGKERCFKRIVRSLVEGATQFPAFCRDQYAATPDIEIAVIFKLTHRIEYRKKDFRAVAFIGVITPETFRIKLKLEIAMDLTIHVDTGIDPGSYSARFAPTPLNRDNRRQ